jgi:hypothetical protein
MHPGFTKTFNTGGAVAKRRVVKFSADGVVVQSAAAADLHVGVSDMSFDIASGARADVRMSGVAEVDAGGACTRGQLATADANGKAVDIAPGAGANVRAFGMFMTSAVNGDVVDVFLFPSRPQG